MGRPGRLGLWILGKRVNTRSSMSVDGEIFCSGEQFLFSYKIVNSVFDNVLIDESEKFGVTVEFESFNIVAIFFNEKILRCELALYTFESEVFRKYLCSRNRPLCCEKIAFNSTRRRNFLRSCLTENLSIFLKMGTKFKP